MDVDVLVRRFREDAGLSLRKLANAAGVATSTVHRIERGDLRPTVAMVQRLAQAAGARLDVDARPDYSMSILGLARAIRSPTESAGLSPVQLSAELAHRFDNADVEERTRMLAAEPALGGDPRWDAFLGGLAEWLAVRVGIAPPAWTQDDGRFLREGWWVTTMDSMRAWEFAGTPMSFQRRGVYLHRESLTNV